MESTIKQQATGLQVFYGMDINTQEKQELAASIRELASLLNSKIEIAYQNGIIVELETNTACMLRDKPAIQANIYEKRLL